MSDKPDIDALLQSTPSPEVAAQLIAWANETRNRIARGDMMIGILSIEDVARIPEVYRKAAECSQHSSWVTLAWWHAGPDYGEPDLAASETAIRNAIEANVENAKFELARIRWFRKRESATETEQEEAYRLTSEIVRFEPENADAIYLLALLQTHGFGVEASPETGLELQQRAADLGNSDAMFEISLHYAFGLGVDVDEEASLKACQRAAKAGHPRAMYNMGAFNASGSGMPKNIPEAIKWYERAADEGNPLAMAGLAAIYAMGDGVEKDLEYAEQMLDQADYLGLDVRELREQCGL